METTARTGHRYFVTYIDGHSHHLVVKLIKTKDEVFPLTKEYFSRAEVETGEKPNFLKSKGIHHEKTNVYTPQENGVAERMNRTLVETARAMLSDANLPNSFWGDAILYATHLINRAPTHAVQGDLTPYEAFTEEKRKKLDAKSLECILLGEFLRHGMSYSTKGILEVRNRCKIPNKLRGCTRGVCRLF